MSFNPTSGEFSSTYSDHGRSYLYGAPGRHTRHQGEAEIVRAASLTFSFFGVVHLLLLSFFRQIGVEISATFLGFEKKRLLNNAQTDTCFLCHHDEVIFSCRIATKEGGTYLRMYVIKPQNNLTREAKYKIESEKR